MLAVPRNAADCVVQDLATLVQTATDKAGCPKASSIAQGVPIYTSASLHALREGWPLQLFMNAAQPQAARKIA